MLPLLLSLASTAVQAPPERYDSAKEDVAAEQHGSRGSGLLRAGDLQGAERELREAVRLSPGDASLVETLAVTLAMQRRFEEAGAFFQQAVTLNPSDLAYRRNLAANEWQLGHLEAARQNLEHILKVSPGDKGATFLLGMVCENSRDYIRALRLLASVPDLTAQQPEALAALARSYYKTGQRERARGTLDDLKVHFPDPAQTFLAGQIAAEADDYQTAERMFGSISKSHLDPATLGYNLAEVQYRAAEYAKAEATLVGLIDAGHRTSEIFNLLGWCYEKQGKPLKEVVRSLDQAIELQPANESNYVDLINILTSHNRFGVARAVAKQGLERLPTSFRICVLQGDVESGAALFADAVNSYLRARELRPDAPELTRKLSNAQARAGLAEEAIVTCKEGLKRFPKDALNYQECGILSLHLAASAKVTEEEAVSLLKAALALDGSLANSHHELGRLALDHGQITEALRHLEKAAELEPNNSSIHLSLARTYRELGRESDAIEQFAIHAKLKAQEDGLAEPQPK
jgi:Flp pilus assembly protein TadD